MSLYCNLRKNPVLIYDQPDHQNMDADDSSSTNASSILCNDIQEDDYILCIERDGAWFNCYTRNMSGWIHASYLQPAILPCTFIINDELPPDAQIRLRTKPSDDDNAVGSVVSPGTIIFVVEIRDKWLRLNYQGNEAWMKREVNDDLILAVPVVPKLYEKGPTVPQGCSLRLRDSPKDDGNVTRLSESDYFLGVNCSGNYIQVIGHPHQTSPSSSSSTLLSPEWMLRKTSDGVILLQESKKKPQFMCIQQAISQDAILRIREIPESTGGEVGNLTYWDIFPVWFVDGVWVYTLSDLWEGFVLSATGSNQLIQQFQPIYPTSQHKKKEIKVQMKPQEIPSSLPEKTLETSTNVPQKFNPFDDQPLPSQGASKSNPFDEQPLPSKSSSKSSSNDDRQLKESKANPFDEQPLPSPNKSKPNPFDEQPLPSQTLSKSHHPEDERPLKGSKSYAFDEQAALPSPNKAKPNPFDEQPLPSQTSSKSHHPEDERPISGSKSYAFDEQALPSQSKSKPNPFDEQQLDLIDSQALPSQSSTKSQPQEEYQELSEQTKNPSEDLLNNNETGHFSKKPTLKSKKGPPARLLQKKTIPTEKGDHLPHPHPPIHPLNLALGRSLAAVVPNDENVPNGNIEKPSTEIEIKKKVEILRPHDPHDEMVINPQPNAEMKDPYEYPPSDDRPHGNILDLMNSYTPENQIEGLRLLVALITTLSQGNGSKEESPTEVFNSLVFGLCSCLQETNQAVKEEAVKSLMAIQGINSNLQGKLISPESAVTLATILTTKLFSVKFIDDFISKSLPNCSNSLLKAYPKETIPSFANGLVSKNLHCVLNIVTFFYEAVGSLLTQTTLPDGTRSEEIKLIIHNLLFVFTNSKPKMKSLALKTLTNLAKIWPLDLSAVLEGEYEDVDASLLSSSQIQDLLHLPQSSENSRSTAVIEPERETQPIPPPTPPKVVLNSPPIRTKKSNQMIEEQEIYEPPKSKISPPTSRKSSTKLSSPVPTPTPVSVQTPSPLPPPVPSLSGSLPDQSTSSSLATTAVLSSPKLKSHTSTSSELNPIDESLLELLMSSFSSKDLDTSLLFSSSSSSSSSSVKKSSLGLTSVGLLGDCQEDFDAIDKELINYSLQQLQRSGQGQGQGQGDQKCSRNYQEIFQKLSNEGTIDDELTSIFQREVQEYVTDPHYEGMRNEILASPSHRSSNQSEAMQLAQIDSFEFENIFTSS